MLFSRRTFCFLGMPVLAGLRPATRAAAAEGLDKSAIDTIAREALEAWKVPGVALAVVYRGRVYLGGYGVKELGKNNPVTPDTVFPLASCTKSFTTTAMAMLVDEGRLAWDDPVRKYVDYFRLADPLADANVTLRDLVSHRTGLDSHDLLWYRSRWDQKEIIRRMRYVAPSWSFRSHYHYQSVMVMAAGQAVAAAAGTTWDDFVQKRILGPLDMKRGTSFTTPAAHKSGNYASPHRKNDQGKIEVIPWYPMTVPDPAGSVNSTASDLSKWVKFHLGDGTWGGKRLVSAANLTETHSPQTIIRLEGDDKAFQPLTHQMSYCMGWVTQDYRGQLLVSHGGSIDGFRAHFTLVPEAQLGIVLLNNLEGTQMNLAISNSIVDLVLGLAPKDWNAHMLAVVRRGDAAKQEVKKQWRASRRRGTKPSRELSAYAGSYENPAYGTARVALKDGALTWEWSGFKGPLEHFHYDTFTAREEFLGDPTMVFLLGADGDVAGMTFEGQDFAKTGR